MFDLITLTAKDLGIAENLQEYGGNVTLSGMLIVFVMLIALVIVISVFGSLMSRTSGAPKKEKAAKQPKPEKKVEKKTKTPVVSAAPAAVASDDDDVIAAISAAVMMMYEGTGKTPIIRSIRPATFGARSAWRAAGIANNTRPF